MADKPKKTETNKLTRSLDTILYKKPRVLAANRQKNHNQKIFLDQVAISRQ